MLVIEINVAISYRSYILTINLKDFDVNKL